MTRSVAVVCLLLASALGGCSQGTATGNVAARPMRLQDLAKSDIDQVAEIHVQEVRDQLATLMRKLYRRNPSQWRNTGKPSAEFVVQRVFRGSRVPDFEELAGRRGVEAVRAAFDEAYDGDRVLALVAGLAAMVDRSYGDQREFFILDSLDPQRLYNSARNIELAAWLLRTRTAPSGQPLLLSHSLEGDSLNLSFERLFGKVISLQDTLAKVVAERSSRTIRTVVRGMASTVFLPI